MKAIAYARYGNPEVLQVCDVPEREPAADQVVVKVHAASINPADWKIMRGDYPLLAGRRLPRRAGSDFSGRVVAVGANARRFQVGEAVLGFLNPFSSREGSLAESICVSERDVAQLPDGVSFMEGAAIPCAGLSAVDCLRRLGGAKAGQRLLVIGATGGVGMFCVQLAKHWGLHVTAVCQKANAAFAHELGADAAVAYDVEDPLRMGGSFDLIIDVAAKYSFGRCKHLLSEHGTYVKTLPGPQMFFDAFRTGLLGNRRARFLIARISSDTIAEVAHLTAARKIRVVLGHVFPFEQTRAAFEKSMSEHARGKIVVAIAESL